MTVPRRVISPEAVAVARRLYEETNVPMADIAAMLGIGVTTLTGRAKLWEWTPRSRRMPLRPPPPPAAAVDGEAPPAPAPLSRRALMLGALAALLVLVLRWLGRGGQAF